MHVLQRLIHEVLTAQCLQCFAYLQPITYLPIYDATLTTSNYPAFDDFHFLFATVSGIK